MARFFKNASSGGGASFLSEPIRPVAALLMTNGAIGIRGQDQHLQSGFGGDAEIGEDADAGCTEERLQQFGFFGLAVFNWSSASVAASSSGTMTIETEESLARCPYASEKAAARSSFAFGFLYLALYQASV